MLLRLGRRAAGRERPHRGHRQQAPGPSLGGRPPPLQLAVIAMTMWPSTALSKSGTNGGTGAGSKRQGGVGDKRTQEVGAGPHTPASTTRVGTVAGRTAPRHVTGEGGLGRGCSILPAVLRRNAGGGGAAGTSRKRQEHGEEPGGVPAAAVPRRSWGAGRESNMRPRPRRGASAAPAIAGIGLRCPEYAPQPTARAAVRPYVQCRRLQLRRPRPGPRPRPPVSAAPTPVARGPGAGA